MNEKIKKDIDTAVANFYDSVEKSYDKEKKCVVCSLYSCDFQTIKEMMSKYYELGKKKFGEVAKFETRVLIDELNRRGFQIKDEYL